MDNQYELLLAGSMVISVLAAVMATGLIMAKFWYWLAWGGVTC